MQNKKCIVCHYGEIALKGKNKPFFIKKLVRNIKEALPSAKVYSPHGRIIVFSEEERLEEKIKKICGIDYFFLADIVPSSVEKIREEAVSLIKKKEFRTFRVTTKRGDKKFSLSSQKLSALLGGEIVKETKKEVDLFNPDVTCFIEITKKETYIYFEKIEGLGGIPVSSSGKAISLISGGIDSPVASFYMMKRGIKNVFLHFHAYPSTSKESILKVERIVKKLSSFQGKSVLYLVPFDEIQKEIMLNSKEKFRVLLYRRFMMRIAEEITKKEKAKAIITGESLGQVASQTMENIEVTGSVVNIPVFRPLIGLNKREIISEAEKIGTYDISILAEEDCCVRFLPKNPETRGEISKIIKEEDTLPTERLIKEALEKAVRKII
jgi:tRNA uracil 4-sulfurtransferase